MLNGLVERLRDCARAEWSGAKGTSIEGRIEWEAAEALLTLVAERDQALLLLDNNRISWARTAAERDALRALLEEVVEEGCEDEDSENEPQCFWCGAVIPFNLPFMNRPDKPVPHDASCLYARIVRTLEGADQ